MDYSNYITLECPVTLTGAGDNDECVGIGENNEYADSASVSTRTDRQIANN